MNRLLTLLELPLMVTSYFLDIFHPRKCISSLRDVRHWRVISQDLLCIRRDLHIRKLGFGRDVGSRCGENTMKGRDQNARMMGLS